MLVEISNLTKRQVNKKELEKIILFILKELKLKVEVSLVFIGKKRMQTLNYTWRKKDKPTDVLTFINPDFTDKAKKIIEIFINLDDCKKTKKYQDFFDFIPKQKDVLHWLLIHGLLHGAGYKDEKEKDRKEIVDKGKSIFKKLKKKV
jgi:probable rRNA maturation factor